jgi:hypothetical protein
MALTTPTPDSPQNRTVGRNTTASPYLLEVRRIACVTYPPTGIVDPNEGPVNIQFARTIRAAQADPAQLFVSRMSGPSVSSSVLGLTNQPNQRIRSLLNSGVPPRALNCDSGSPRETGPHVHPGSVSSSQTEVRCATPSRVQPWSRPPVRVMPMTRRGSRRGRRCPRCRSIP